MTPYIDTTDRLSPSLLVHPQLWKSLSLPFKVQAAYTGPTGQFTGLKPPLLRETVRGHSLVWLLSALQFSPIIAVLPEWEPLDYQAARDELYRSLAGRVPEFLLKPISTG